MEQMKLAERERDVVWALERFRECDFVTLSINHKNHGPYQIPICVIVIGEVIYFHTALEGQTRRLLIEDPRVTLGCVTHTKLAPGEFTMYFRSAFASGRVFLIDDYQEKYDAMYAFGEKYLQNENIHYMAERIASGRALVYRFEPHFLIGKEHKPTVLP